MTNDKQLEAVIDRELELERIDHQLETLAEGLSAHVEVLRTYEHVLRRLQLRVRAVKRQGLTGGTP